MHTPSRRPGLSQAASTVSPLPLERPGLLDGKQSQRSRRQGHRSYRRIVDPLVIAIAALVVAGALGLLLSGAHRHLPRARRILVSERRLGLRLGELRRRAQVLSDAEREFFSINGRYGEQTDLMAVLTTPELTADCNCIQFASLTSG